MTNPNLKIMPSSSDRLADFVSLAILVLAWIFLLSTYAYMPEIVPIHLDGSGKADGFANKTSLFIGPSISLIIYIVLTYLNKYPQIYNYPSVINENNAAQYYTIGSRMIRYLKLSVMIVFLLIQFEIFAIAKGIEFDIGVWSLIIPLTIILAPTIYFIVRIFSIKKT